MNETFGAMLLGAVQGLTEFLPVSSSGHLVLFQQFLPVPGDPVAFDLVLHLGTLMPVFWVYRASLLEIIRDFVGGEGGWLERKGVRLGAWVVVGSVPTAAIGLAFEDLFTHLFANTLSVGIAFFVTAALLYGTRFAPGGDTDESSMKWWHAVLIGVVQGLAITPGISRSGSTIALALFLGMNREYAARFSFLLSIPAILGAFLLKASDLTVTGAALPPLVGGFIAAAAVGYVALVVLIRLVKSGDFSRFAWYLIGVGILSIGLALG